VVIYEDVFAALAAADVPYVVVGGVAVLLHGHVRATVDLDIVIDLAAEPAGKAVDTLLGLGLKPRLPVDPHDFADGAVRRDWIESRNLQVFSFYDPAAPLREVDLFATYPVPFDELLRDSVLADVGSTQVRIASVAHLIEINSPPLDHRTLPTSTLCVPWIPAMTAADWSAATFAGARRRTARAAALTTPEQRLQWLEDALRLAWSAGALDRVRDERQSAAERSWANTSS
jgi:hypothetical protein